MNNDNLYCNESKYSCITKKLMVTTNDNATLLIAPCDILYLEAKRSYTQIYTKTGQSYCVPKPLKSFEDRMCSQKFVRCSRSYMINKEHVSGFHKGAKMIILQDSYAVPSTATVIKELIGELAF